MTLRSASALLALALTLGCSSTPPAPEPRADLLIRNGVVLTMSSAGTIENGSIAVRDGAIVAVGPSAEIDSAWPAAKTIDARGRLVLPGLVNGHTHVPMTLFRGIADDRALMDWLQNFIFPAEAKNVTADFVRWGTRLGAAEMIRSGTTTFADMYYFESDIAEVVDEVGLRAVLGETLIDFPAPDNKTWDAAIDYSKRFVAKWKGHPRITPALAPHAPFTVSKEHLVEVRALASEIGAPILIHVAETEDEVRQVREKQNLSPVAYLDSINFLGPDVVSAHTIWVDQAEIAMLARRRVGVVHNPQSNMMLASGVAPVAALRKAGVPVGIGTDGPAGSNNNLDMIDEMASAARLQKITRTDPQALGASDVLRMATIDGARAIGLGDLIGSLEPGKRADIIIVRTDTPEIQPVYSAESALVYAANGGAVDTTIVDGRILMEDRRLTTIDLDEVVRNAKRIRDEIVRSLGGSGN